MLTPNWLRRERIPPGIGPRQWGAGRPCRLPEQTCTGCLSTSEQGLHSVCSGIFRPGHPRWLLAFLETLASGGGSENPPPPSAVGPSSPLSPATCSEASRSPSNRPMKCLLVGMGSMVRKDWLKMSLMSSDLGTRPLADLLSKSGRMLSPSFPHRRQTALVP